MILERSQTRSNPGAPEWAVLVITSPGPPALLSRLHNLRSDLSGMPRYQHRPLQLVAQCIALV